MLTSFFITALQLLRGKENVQEEIEEMTQEAKESQTSGLSFHFMSLFRLKELHKPVMVVIVIQIAQAWSGINAVSAPYNVHCVNIVTDKYNTCL